MFRSLKVSVTLGAAVLIAAPGCCCPNLLTSHSSPSEEVVVADYSGGCAGDCSVVSTDCGCGCDAGVVDTTMGESVFVGSEVVDDDKYLIGTPKDEVSSALAQEPTDSGFTPTAAESSSVAGSASKALDVVKPPVDVKSAIDAVAPGNSPPGNLLP